jgi:hypothetical protein
LPGLFPLPTELFISGMPLFNLRPRKDRNCRLSSRRPAHPGPNAARPSRTQYRSRCLSIPLIPLRLVRRPFALVISADLLDHRLLLSRLRPRLLADWAKGTARL